VYSVQYKQFKLQKLLYSVFFGVLSVTNSNFPTL